MSTKKTTGQMMGENDELRRREDIYYKMIAEIQDYAIILLDGHGIIQNWNKGAQKIKLYKEEEAVGKSFEIFYLQEDRQAGLPKQLLENARTSGRAAHEGWRVRKDLTRFWGSIVLTALHDDEGTVIGFSKVTRDLTDKKYAEDNMNRYASELRQSLEALRKSEERYHRVIAEVQDYAIILLNENGDIQNWNLGAERIKGYRADEIIGKNFREFYLPEDRINDLPQKLINEAIANGRATHEGWRLRKDGSNFWGSIVITALHNDKGGLIGFSKMTRDLTDKKHAEDSMIAYLGELELKNKELEEFAYIASHDLQEPLRKIRTFIEIIEKNIADPVLTTKFFAKIQVAATRMTDLILSVLEYSRLHRNRTFTAACDLNAVLADVCNDYELLIQEREALINTETLPVIHAVPLQMHQLFSNLVGNALKFNNNRPIINVSTSEISKHEINAGANLLTEDRYLLLCVEDNGIGFDPQYEKLIFHMFQRLHPKEEYSGTGIGLALCKKILENHGGFILASGEPGKGARFNLYLPLSSVIKSA